MRRLSAILLLSISGLPCWAALAVDSQMTGNAATYAAAQASPLTFAFNNVAGNVLYVGFALDAQGVTVTATYNSVSMTSVGSASANNGTSGTVGLFRLASPATGSNTVSIAWTGGVAHTIEAGAISFSGAAATPDSGTATTANDGGSFASTAFSVTVPSTTNGNIVIQVVGFGDPSFSSVSPGTRTYDSSAHPDGGSFTNNTAAQFASTTGGSKTMTVNGTTATSWATVAIEVKAAAAGGTTCQGRLTTMGVSSCG